MKKIRKWAFASAAVIASSQCAFAADLPPRLPPPPIVQAAPIVEIASGWYLRGDLAYRFNVAGSADSALLPDPVNNRIDDTFAIGLGAGYKWNWLRTDVTFDYGFVSNYKGDSAAFTPDYTAKIQTATALANLYFDLGTWWGFTPYIGGGAGAAYVRMTDFASASFPGFSADSNRWNFAWAAMAGFSYCFTPNLLVDIGYRYLDQGEVLSAVLAPAPNDQQVRVKNLTAHEIRAGIRWAL